MRVTQCVLSHWHHDHVGGVNELRQVCGECQDVGGEREGSGQDGEGLKIYKYPLYGSHSAPTPQSSSDPTDRERERESQLLRSANDDQDLGPIHYLRDGQILQVGDPHSSKEDILEMQVLHTPGHTSDHLALLITSSAADPDEVGTIFTGDAVLGHGTAVFEDLAQYMESLQKMKAAIEEITERKGSPSGDQSRNKKTKVARAFPAHGAVIQDAKGKIEEYIAHRAMRERAVLGVLAGGSSAGAGQGKSGGDDGVEEWTSMEIVKVVYNDVPESLHIAAEGGVVQILRKLELQGAVQESKERDGPRWRLCPESTRQRVLQKIEKEPKSSA